MKYSIVYSKGFLLCIFLLIILSSCIKFRTIQLYDGQEKEPIAGRPDAIEKIVSPILFEDDTLNIWGIVEDSCKSFLLSKDVKYKGESSLKLQWEREGCIWVGFGMGWDDYAGKDLEPILEYAAFQVYVRTQKGKAYGLPCVFTLEDYSGVMSFCYTANKYFERVAIDENWQKVTVPLKAFNDEGEGINYSNIKQLQIEMQQSGSFYMDEISLVFYEEPEIEPWLEEPVVPDPTRLPQVLFEDDFVNQNGWGLVTNSCMTVERSEDAFAGDQAIHAKWDMSDTECKLPLFGLSWAKWNPVDIKPMVDNAVLSFYLKAANLEKLKFQILLEDFNRNTGGVEWRKEWLVGTEKGWSQVHIPMTALTAGELRSLVQTANAADGSGASTFKAKLDQKIIKSLVFKLEGAGEMWMDRMKWIEKTNN